MAVILSRPQPVNGFQISNLEITYDEMAGLPYYSWTSHRDRNANIFGCDFLAVSVKNQGWNIGLVGAMTWYVFPQSMFETRIELDCICLTTTHVLQDILAVLRVNNACQFARHYHASVAIHVIVQHCPKCQGISWKILALRLFCTKWSSTTHNKFFILINKSLEQNTHHWLHKKSFQPLPLQPLQKFRQNDDISA